MPSIPKPFAKIIGDRNSSGIIGMYNFIFKKLLILYNHCNITIIYKRIELKREEGYREVLGFSWGILNRKPAGASFSSG
jgi:hypothetical protein